MRTLSAPIFPLRSYYETFKQNRSCDRRYRRYWAPEIQKSYYFVDTGLIAQNVYLASSSLGLASWFHNCNKAEIAKELKLKPHQRPLFGQTIGYAED